MKRFLVILLTVSVLSSALLFPVSAASSEYLDLIDVLDFATVNGSGRNYQSFNGNFVSLFEFPVRVTLYYIEAVIRIGDPNATIRLIDINGTSYGIMNKESIGNNLYRIWIRNINFSHDIRFQFDTTATNVSYLSVSASAVPLTPSAIGGVLTLASPGDSETITMSDPSTPVQLSIVPDLSNPTVSEVGAQQFFGWIIPDGWEKFDFISIQFRVRSATLNSVLATLEGIAVPCSVSYVDGNLPSYDDIDDGISDEISSVSATRWINVVLDLRGLDRGSLSTLSVGYTGTISQYYTSGFVSLVSIYGYIQANDYNPLYYYLLNIWNSVKGGFLNVVSGVSALGDRLVNQLTSFETNITNWIYNISTKITKLHNDLIEWFDKDTSANDHLDQDLADQESELGDISDSFESVTQPTVSDEQISIEQGINNVSLTTITNWTTTIFGNSWFFTVFNMSMVFCLASVVLFGKR